MTSDCRTLLIAGLTVVLAGCGASSEPAAAWQPPDAAPSAGPAPTQPAAASAPTDAHVATVDAARPAEPDGGRAAALDSGRAADGEISSQNDAGVGVASTSTACPTGATREIGWDEPTSLGTARDMRDAFARAIDALETEATPFRWSQRFGGTTTIAIGAIAWGDKATYTESDQLGCEDLRLPASIRLTTQDGTLDETAEGWVRATQFVGSFDLTGKLSKSLVERAEHPGLTLQSLGVVFSASGEESLVGELNATSDIDDYDLASDLYGLAKFDSAWVRGVELDAPFERAAPIDSMCEAAEPADMSISFSPGVADLPAKLSKVWLRCDGKSTGFPSHEGF
ncbi:MAG TPA: hypothetical protein VMF89_11215, partial [Polyangiales bacterium]|nr:hypothetical protein [Polyangiales bacterium]